MVRNVVGRPVQGEDFFGRAPELDRAWRTLAADNLLLLAPRRVGKTSFMYRLRDTAEGMGFRTVFVDAGRATNEQRFLELLCQELVQLDPSFLARLKAGPLADLFASVRPSAASLGGFRLEFSPDLAASPDRWLEVGDTLLHTLDHSVPTLLLLDEMPSLLLRLLDHDVSRARAFLGWFRSARQHQAHTRWVVAGSIGLDTIAERHALSDTINDLVPFALGAFGSDDSVAFLGALGASHHIGMGPAVCNHLVERLGWPIPFFLQLVARELFEVSSASDPPDVNRVDQAFEALLDASKRSLFVHWRTRLVEQLGPVRGSRARQMLDRAAPATGATFAELRASLEALVPDADERQREVAFLLRVLEHDGYLVQAGERVLFRSPLVRSWWTKTVPHG